MSTGKRRANWETVLEERMVQQQLLISNLNMDRLNQITDLQNKVDAINKKLTGCCHMITVLASLSAFATAVAVLK